MACVVYGCKSHSSNPNKDDNIHGVSYHRFPNDENLKNLWVKAIQRKNWIPTKYSRICSKHFTKDCYSESSQRLSRTAIPTIFENYPTYLQKEATKLATKALSHMRRTVSSLNRQSNQLPESRDATTSINIHGCPNNYSKLYVAETPTEKYLIKKLAKEKRLSEIRLKKLKTFRQKCRRYKLRIISLETNLNKLINSKSVVRVTHRIYYAPPGPEHVNIPTQL